MRCGRANKNKKKSGWNGGSDHSEKILSRSRRGGPNGAEPRGRHSKQKKFFTRGTEPEFDGAPDEKSTLPQEDRKAIMTVRFFEPGRYRSVFDQASEHKWGRPKAEDRGFLNTGCPPTHFHGVRQRLAR